MTLSRKYLEEVIAFILCFFLIHNISFVALPQATTARIGIVFGVVYLTLYKIRYFLNLLGATKPVLLLFLPLPYVGFLWLLIGDYGVLARFINLYLYGVIGSCIVASLLGGMQRAIFIIFGVSVIQAVFIWASFVSVGFMEFLDANVVSGSNYDVFYRYRASGFSGHSGASLSVVQALGLMAFWLKVETGKRLRIIELTYWLGGSFLIFTSILIVGRTGLIIAMIFIFLAAIAGKLLSPKTFGAVAAACAGVIAAKRWFDKEFQDVISTDWFWEWILSAFTGQDGAVEFILATIPNFAGVLFTGSGLVSLVDGSNPSGSDSGYMQFLYAYGLPMFIVFYSSYFFILTKILNYIPLYASLLLAVLFFLIEFKEPFLMKYGLFTVLMILYLSNIKDQSRGTLRHI